VKLTLVACYGDKSEPLRALVLDLQNFLGKQLGGSFRPYELEQVHATIIGLEGSPQSNGAQLINTNYVELRQERRTMDLTKALDIIQHSPLLPIRIRIGGFQRDVAYGMTSRGQHPYQRSFSFQGDSVVALGWPCLDGDFPPSLDQLRRSFNEANILHKYHALPTDVDNDLFFVLGHVEAARVSERRGEIEAAVRDRLAGRDPVHVELDRTNLFVVAYTDPQLPPNGPRRSEVRPIAPLPPAVAELLALYHMAD
jgi:hypothetical protein